MLMHKSIAEKIKNNLQYVGLLLAAVLVGIDQLTKWLVVSNMKLQDSIHIIKIGDTEVLNFSYYLNSGAAFSKFEGKTTMLVVVTSLVIAALILLLVLKKIKRTPYIVAASLIIGGGIGNLIDRLFNNGLVVDFIDFRIINFAIFNFADICAVCGAALLFIMVVVDEVRDNKKKRLEKAADNAESGNAAENTAENAENGNVAENETEKSDDGND